MARLKRGVTLQQAQAEMGAITGRIAQLYPAEKKGWSAIVDRLIDRLVGDRTWMMLMVLMSAVVAVLLIGCANLANLLMARATLRSREIALRVALGAGRRRVIRMLLTESVLLSVCGAVVGIGFGYALLNWILSLMPPFFLPSEVDIRMDGRVLLFLAGAAILTGVAFGLMPALQASRGDVNESLKEGGRASSASRASVRLRHAFVIAQVALAFIFLVGGGLFIRSFQRVMAVDIGYQTEGIIAAYLPLKMDRDPDVVELTQYVQQLIDEVRAVPGMHAAAVATALPLSGWGDGMPMLLPASRDVRRNRLQDRLAWILSDARPAARRGTCARRARHRRLASGRRRQRIVRQTRARGSTACCRSSRRGGRRSSASAPRSARHAPI